MQYNTSIYLDKRKSSKKTNNLFPVKIRVYSTITKKKKLYPTGVDLSIEDFEDIFNSDKKFRGNKKEIEFHVRRIHSNAEDIAKNLNPFTFETFEKKMFRAKNASINIEHHYKEKIKAFKENEQLSSASNYDLALKTFDAFLKLKTKTILKNLTFYDITVDWLNKYEKYMINDKDRTTTTVSIYLRTLRTIFNDAIRENEIKKEIYPFGKGKYQIPTTTKSKKALSKEQITALFNAEPQTPEQVKAKDFWFFSYACYGMNMKDITLLRYENLTNNTIKYFRAKTTNTKKGNLKETEVFLNKYAKGIIKKYGHKTKTKKQFIFPIVLIDDDAAEQKRKIKNFTSFVNLHINKLAKNNGFTFNISTYWARHSFATLSIQKGVSMEFISDALNHSNMNVTKNYFAGFEDEAKKEFSNNLMDF
ncbi:tyrosine-type recombinase/integrase [Kordia zhangzhouensis]|uniref:tyrosine-type recombinase/integrase n=1 Tax=Kordia zhangzhouensis TaxID=1620405 RepID=UPI000629CA78|nr:site-specific integrase [Kordia zhangzhouensis]